MSNCTLFNRVPAAKGMLSSKMKKQFKAARSLLSKSGIQLISIFGMIGLFAIVIIFVEGTHSAEQSSHQKKPLTDFQKFTLSGTLSVIRTSQGVLASISSLAIQQSFLDIQSSMINHEDGLSYHNFLALEPTLGFSAAVRIVSERLGKVSIHSRLWAVLR